MRRLFSVSPWWVFLAVGIVLAGGFSFVIEGRQAARAALRYVGVWESEIARSLLTGEGTEETAKLLAQIEEFHPALKVHSAPADVCPWPVRRSISLYSLPATEITICRDRAAVLRQSLISPVFLGSLALLFILGLIGSGREHRARLLRQAAEARAESESQRAELARRVAHDIRGPLSALNLLARNARAMDGAERDLLSSASSRINDIAEELLRGSRAGIKVTEKSSPAKLGLCLLDETVGTLRAETAARFPAHRIDWSLSAAVSVPVDAGSLLRTLSNLVQNAVEASPAGASILIATRAASESVSLVVADSGRGIPEDLLPRLGREELSHGKDNGNGLGLSEARRLMDHGGGQLLISSKVGVGTQVELRWPREAAHSSITNPSSSSSVFR